MSAAERAYDRALAAHCAALSQCSLARYWLARGRLRDDGYAWYLARERAARAGVTQARNLLRRESERLRAM